MNPAPLAQRLASIHGITITPFSDSGSVDLGGVEANVGHLVDGGVDVLVACGNTGEYSTLTPDERRQVVARTGKLLADVDAIFVVGVGQDLGTAAADARHAAEHGAHAVMVHQPPTPFVSREGFLTYHENIAAASPVPTIPYVSRPVLTPDDVPRLLDTAHPVAVKYAVNDPPVLADCVAADTGGDTVWIAGTAEGWAPFLWPAGAVGFTSGLVNVTTTLSRRLLAALQTGDAVEVRAIWQRLQPFEQLRAADDGAFNVAVVKEAMRQWGMPAGDVRPPASPTSEVMRDRIATILEDWSRTQRASDDGMET